MSDTNRHGVYDSPNDPGMSPSNCCLVREPSQFREASISCTSPSNSPTPRTESKEKKSGNDGKSKFLSLFEKLPSRPKNAETILAAESSGNYNFEGGNGRNLPAGDTRFTSSKQTWDFIEDILDSFPCVSREAEVVMISTMFNPLVHANILK